MKLRHILTVLSAVGAVGAMVACDDEENDGVSSITNANTYGFFSGETTAETFAKGADVSWLTEMEDNGQKFYTAEGDESECMALLKSLGVNSIRLRVWVDPAEHYCDKQDVLVKARRAAQLGMKVMIDFHYSDEWADPSHQTKPAAWTDLSYTDLCQAVSNHTTDVLSGLKAIGVTPTWVQIGNEVGDGLLWGDGRASTNSTRFAELVSTGAEAAKAVFPETKIVIHVQNGWNYNTTSWIMNVLKTNNVAYDILGVSLYPEEVIADYGTAYGTVTDIVALTVSNIKSLSVRYNKEMMVCEFGYSVSDPEKGYECLSELISTSRESGVCAGVFYWEPESYNWNGYGKGAFGADGKPLKTLDAFGL